ncbi:uncharacterized protein TNCV_2073051 [Trichonephila clavipes]|uniref:Uncharacterized protein n=1 Tax=Trichonephila clavipes TaxID=2585209 RepID=A0A8X6RD95_TRICX|nr:uncharacterized protein TNCV_2073051 [Trichonephila clavipes]
MIKNYVNEQHDTWDKFLRKFDYAIRTAVNETMGKTPAELFLGRKLITPFQKLVMVSDRMVSDGIRLNLHKKRRTQDKVAASVKRYRLRPRDGREVESRPAMEMKTQQGGPVLSRKSRGRKENPCIEERTRSGNRDARRRGDQQREDQEKKDRMLEDPCPYRSCGGAGHLLSQLKEVETDQAREKPAKEGILFMIEKLDEHETKGKLSNAP